MGLQVVGKRRRWQAEDESTYWMSVEYLPGLIIRVETKSKQYTSTMTLEEFSDGE
jgi:hypothetical protein